MNKIRFAVLLFSCFTVMTFFSACTPGNGEPPPPEGGNFSNADLTATWNMMEFVAGANTGVSRSTLEILSSGAANFTFYEDSYGGSAPADGVVNFTVSSSGAVTLSGISAISAANCAMSTDKNTILCAATRGSDSYEKIILFKTTGATFSNADLSGPLSWNSHAMYVGGPYPDHPFWQYAVGTIDASLALTVTFMARPGQTFSGEWPYGNLFVASDGFVTSDNSALENAKGMLSTDKKMLVLTDIVDYDPPPAYSLTIFTFADETFTGTSDLAGTWDSTAIWAGASAAGWKYLTGNINSSGVLSISDFMDSAGNTTPGSSLNFSLATDGIITSSDNATLHGILSHGRIVYVSTDSDGNNELDLMLKR